MNIAPAALASLFTPRTVAVVGVSSDPAKIGSVVYRNLAGCGFAGTIHPVGRARGEINGRPCHARLADIAAPIDVAFLAVPAAAVADALEDAAAAGVKVAIVGASGFAESGDIAAQQRQADIAARTGLRIVGPNCNGIFNAHLPLSLGFNTAHARRLRPGGVGLLSHSGALFDPLVRLLDSYGSGISCFVSAGNEVDLSILDYMDYLVDDPDTRVIALLIDSIADGDRFARAAGRATAAGKSIVALKLGTSTSGAVAAVAHSSRMTGSATAYAAFLHDLGIPVAKSLEGLMTSAALLDHHGRQPGGLATITSSGAGGALVADLAGHHGIPLAVYDDDTCQTVAPFQTFSTLGNPTDLGVFGASDHWPAIFDAIARDKAVGVIMAYIHAFGGKAGANMMDGLAEAQRASGKPVIVLAPGGFGAEESAAYEQRGLPVLSDTDACLQAVAALLTPPAPPRPESADAGSVAGLSLPDDRTMLGEAESLELLRQWGVPAVEARICADAAAAAAAAHELGWPVVVKGAIEGLAHKSDDGLVRLNISDAAGIAAAAAAFGKGVPMIVQPMIAGDLEAIIGVSRAPGVGTVLMAGLGGIYAEALDDVSLWPIGASRAAIEEKLDRSALGRVLSSSRWRYPGARGALVDALLALQAFALTAGERIEAVDINPLILGRNGATAVDALIVLRPAA